MFDQYLKFFQMHKSSFAEVLQSKQPITLDHIQNVSIIQTIELEQSSQNCNILFHSKSYWHPWK